MTTSPARGRYARSSITGRVPDSLEPGSFGINWADKKLYVGDGGGVPIRFSQWLEDWNVTKFYYRGDFSVFEGVIWRARDDLAAGTPFTVENWEPVTLSGRSRFSEPFASGIVTGGVATIAVSGTSVDVEAGSGLVVQYATPIDVLLTEVNWGAFSLPVSGSPGWYALGIDNGGVATLHPAATIDGGWWHANILIAYVLWDGAAIESLRDGSLPPSGVAEAVRDAYRASGGAYRASGLRIASSTGLTLRMTAGYVFDLGGTWRADLNSANVRAIAAMNPISFRYATRNDVPGVPVTTLNFGLWDNAGSLGAVPAGSATIQYLSLMPSGEVYIQYGQALYATLDAASVALAENWDSFVRYTAAHAGPPIVLAALIATVGVASSAGVRIVAAARGEPFLATNGGGSSGGIDTSLFLPRSGALAMLGNLDLGGFALRNGVIEGDPDVAANRILIKSNRVTTTGTAPATTVAADVGEIVGNSTDGKLWIRNSTGAPVLAGAAIKAHSTTRAYLTGDIVYASGGLWRAPGAVGPGAFNSADWTDLSGGGADDAILKVPASVSGNTINLTGLPTRKGLVIDGDPLQTAALLDIPGTAAADTRSATIDALGFPNERFGTVVFRVGQSTHPFSFRGQAVAFASGQWQLANAAVSNRYAIGVVEQIIDDNSFVVRTSGKISQLQASAFAGGVITAATRYFVSDTVPGQLTSVVPASRVDPVLITTTTSEAVVVTGVGASAANFVEITGSTMTGPLTMAPNVQIRFEDANSRIQKPSSASVFQFLLGGAEAARVEPAGTAISDPQAVVTREKGDLRYVLSSALMNFVYPVGRVIFMGTSANPNTAYPGTTWVQIGQGRTIVGVGTADGLAWTLKQVRGEADVALTEAQLAVHDHNVGSLKATATPAGNDWTFDIRRTVGSNNPFPTIFPVAGITQAMNGTTDRGVDSDGNHEPNQRITHDATHNHPISMSGAVANAGSGAAHNNIQPSIAYYIWERTA